MKVEAESPKGSEAVLAPVIERLREESRVDLRMAREEFARELAALRHQQQVSFTVGFAIFLLASLVLIATTYFSLRSLSDSARRQVEAQQQAAGRLSILEEQSRARLESLKSLERRVRVDLLERPGASPAPGESAQEPAPTPEPSGEAGGQALSEDAGP